MTTLTGATRETMLYMHTLASAVACASQSEMPVLVADPVREPSPAAQRLRVLRNLDSALDEVDALLRSKKVQPVGVPTATLGRRMIESGEIYDAVNHTYTPGSGFDALIAGVYVDAVNTLSGSAANGKGGDLA